MILKKFIEDVGGPTAAASVLCVSGAVVHKWNREGLSNQAAAQITAWLRFRDYGARLVLHTVWAAGTVWRPTPEQYREWLDAAMLSLWKRTDGAAWVGDLWKEVQQ